MKLTKEKLESIIKEEYDQHVFRTYKEIMGMFDSLIDALESEGEKLSVL